jgi:hypothetical protein
MTRILDVVGKYMGTDSGQDADTPLALERLKHILAEQAPALVSDPPAGDPSLHELDPDTLRVTWLAAVHEETVTHPAPEERADAMRQDATLNAPESNEVTSPDESMDVLADDIGAAAVETADPATQQVTEAAFEVAVKQAQHEAEAQLSDVVARIRQAAADQHAIELRDAIADADSRREQAEAAAARAREETDRRHAEELLQARETVEAELTAAVERARKEEADRHAVELARAREVLERQHTSELQHARTAVMDSFKALTARVLQSV